MRARVDLSVVAALLFCTTQAQATQTITPIAKASAGVPVSNNIVLTTTADCPVHSLIVAFVGAGVEPTNLSSATDQAGNTYGSPFDGQNNVSASTSLKWIEAVNTASDLPSGDTITLTFTSSGSDETPLVTCIPGSATSSPVDVSGKTANGGSTAATSATAVTSGTLAQANEAVLVGTVTATSSGSFTCNGGSWTKEESEASGAPSATLGGQVVSSTSSVSSTGCNSWNNSVTWLVDMITLKAAAPVLGNGVLLKGAGP